LYKNSFVVKPLDIDAIASRLCKRLVGFYFFTWLYRKSNLLLTIYLTGKKEAKPTWISLASILNQKPWIVTVSETIGRKPFYNLHNIQSYGDERN
jgi:hypothetical protein